MTILLKCLSSWLKGLSAWEKGNGSLLREQVVDWTESNYAKERTSGLPLHAVQGAIRFQTFEALGLTHTCCLEDHTNPFRPRCDPSEVAEIHEEERWLLQELEKIVSKFVQAYEQQEGSLALFLRGYWRSEMVRVLTEYETPKAEQIDELRRIGVVIENTDERRSQSTEEAGAESRGSDTTTPEGNEGAGLDKNTNISDQDWILISAFARR